MNADALIANLSFDSNWKKYAGKADLPFLNYLEVINILMAWKNKSCQHSARCNLFLSHTQIFKDDILKCIFLNEYCGTLTVYHQNSSQICNQI